MSGYLTDEEYRHVYSRAPRLCVDLAVVTSWGLLLTPRDVPPHEGLWHTPGGRVRYKETLEQAASRIAKTEIGVDVACDDLLGYMEMVDDGEFAHSVSLVFFVHQMMGLPRGKWFRELPDDVHPVHKEFYARHWNRIATRMTGVRR